MPKHVSLYLEEKLLQEAARVLGTTGPTRTMRAALEDVVRRARLKELTRWELELSPDDVEELRQPGSG